MKLVFGYLFNFIVILSSLSFHVLGIAKYNDTSLQNDSSDSSEGRHWFWKSAAYLLWGDGDNNSSKQNSYQCENSKTIINKNQKVCKSTLIFEDNFEELNWNKWDRDIRIPSESDDAEFVSFQDFEENLYIKNGILHILPKLLTKYQNYDDSTIRNGELDLGEKCTGVLKDDECKRRGSFYRILPPVVSARISTKHKFTFKYGIVEVRAKLPKGDWLFPQLFLEPYLNYYGSSSYSSGQIRLAFIRSNEILDSVDGKQIDGFRLFGGVVLAQDEKYRETWMKSILRRTHFANDYHIFKTTWTEEFLSFEVDTVEYARFRGNFAYEAFDLHGIKYAANWKNGDFMAPFDKDFFLSFGISVGGISDFPDKSSSGKREFQQKPWKNCEVKNELNFWKAKDLWYSTWDGENAALKIDYVRVWAL